MIKIDKDDSQFPIIIRFSLTRKQRLTISAAIELKDKLASSLTLKKDDVSEVPCSDGLANPTPAESAEIWSDMIAEAKARGDIGDLSSIAHRLILIACTGGFKAH